MTSSHTNDPQMADARVFIGNLPTEKVEKALLLTIFKKYGEVTGVSIHKGFAFVQYTHEEDARDAVENEHGKEIYGNSMDCKIASEGKGSGSSRVESKSRQSPAANGPARFNPRPDSPPSRFYGDPPPRRHVGGGPYPPSEYYGPPPSTTRPIYPPPGPATPPMPLPESPFLKYQAEILRERPFDCLVISTDPSLNEYLEFVLSKLKSISGLRCHKIVYPSPAPNYITGPHLPGSNVNIGETKRLVDDAARMGCCPITIGPITFINSVQNSLSVNMHYGKVLEEHRNMPLQDALHLIVNSFAQYCQQERAQRISPNAIVSYPVSALTHLNSSINNSSDDRDRHLNSARGGRETDQKSTSSGKSGAVKRGATEVTTNGTTDESTSSDNDRKSTSSNEEVLPPWCKRQATLDEVIKYVLISVEKCSATPKVTVEELDKALEVLNNARNKLTFTPASSSNSYSHPNTIHNSTALAVSSHPQYVNLVTALPTSSCSERASAADLHVSTQSNTCPLSAAAVLDATYVAGGGVTYMATPAIVSHSIAASVNMETTAIAVEASMDNMRTTTSVVASPSAAAAYGATFGIHTHPQPSVSVAVPQSGAATAIIGTATPCFIHDSTNQSTTHAAMLQYHHHSAAAPTVGAAHTSTVEAAYMSSSS